VATSEVTEVEVGERLTAVVAATTTWQEFPALWGRLLAEVWQTVRGDDLIKPGRNVMVYLDDTPRVEIGAEAAARFEPIGDVVSSVLPAGRALMTTFSGSYAGLDEGHRAVSAAFEERGLEQLGPRFEIYSHQPGPEEVEIYYLVA